MKIYLKDINYYFLTVDPNSDKKKHIMEIFKGYNITEVNPVVGIDKSKSGAIGHSRIIDLALRNQNRNKIFQPFMVLEDDISFYSVDGYLPEYIEVPDESDIVYTGVSNCGMTSDGWGYNNLIAADCINTTILKIYNMLSSHAFMVCSPLGAAALQKCYMEGCIKNQPWDIFMSNIQPYYNVYALKIPLFYQDNKYGGAETCTKRNFGPYTDDLTKLCINNTSICCVSVKIISN